MRTWIKTIAVAATITAVVYSCSKNSDFWSAFIPETDEQPTTAEIKGYVFRPAIVSATPENISQLKVPAGFKLNKFADKLGKPRILVVSSTGNVYTSDREAGTVTLLKDANKDGVSDATQIVANIEQAHGL